MDEKRVIIAGGRDFKPTLQWAELLMKAVHDLQPTAFVCGMARGADEMAVHMANLCGLECMCFKPDWDKHGKAAGPIRNKDMAEFAHALIVFPGGRGTQNMIDTAEQHGLPVYHLWPPEEQTN